MSEFKETVTTSQEENVDNTGNPVQQQTRTVDKSASASGRSVAENVIWYIVGTISVLLAFRFVLKLFGANPASGFVDLIYSITGVLTAPFDNIFGVAQTTTGEVNSVFEPSILVAAVVYALIGWGIVKMINLNRAK
ncbi:hypothetical protein BH23PAT2_BH23PAT2_09580 [soil metagenome]